ncbi:Uncharacterized protein FWK35_00035663, partial [Aphis craccivora]
MYLPNPPYSVNLEIIEFELSKLIKKSDKIIKNKNDDEFIGIAKSVGNQDNLLHQLQHTDKSPVSKGKFLSRITEMEKNLPMLSTDDEIELTPKKRKLIQLTSPMVLRSHNKVEVNSNNSSISCRKKKLKLDLSNNMIDNLKDNRNSSNFNYNKSSDEISEEFQDLEKERMELSRLPPRRKSVNLNDNISKKCKYFIKNLKKYQSTAIVDTNYYMPHENNIDNYIENMKNKFKSLLYQPTRTSFYKKLVKSPEHFEVFSLKEGYINITAEKGMVNLYDALKSFEKKQQYTIKFVKSNLGDALKRYTANRDVCWDVVHLESNTEEDLLKYRLCYGAIPDKYILELEMIICRLLVSKLNNKSKKSTDNVKQLVNRDYDFLEGELELLVFNYWQKSTRDMFEYKENVNRKKTKM